MLRACCAWCLLAMMLLLSVVAGADKYFRELQRQIDEWRSKR